MKTYSEMTPSVRRAITCVSLALIVGAAAGLGDASVRIGATVALGIVAFLWTLIILCDFIIHA